MNNSIINRLQVIIEESGLSVSQFASKIGFKQGNLSLIMNGKRNADNKNLISNISNTFGIREEWLRYGSGNRFVAEDSSDVPQADKSADNSTSDLYYTYLIPMSAMAGSLIGFDADGVCPTECERIVSPIAGVDFAISVYGDSMMPEFPSGSRVLIKRIDPTIYIDWGNVFVLDTANGVILKEVQPSDKEGTLTCHSLNPNGRYKDFDVPMCEIRAMYKVLACVSMR